ncbi:lipid IV(A) 3-deoxy-D-manno-octulosonic acid transferase [Marinobacter nanhaiticus D15-8W]|uniref:3-deoxy-D-manno-octulosonic acid transferase n=1 Tax=Marinobacter nanhaiticus D15-8W TaxID=626887 RepID=N6VQU5_9GAMM|nr:lipid IV(A) 3-deoxy-D-manno-octulosonic acid transferase [Marinobacter nanhaiticus]ENO12580.1 3-deoxy-D-manno-octulosonic acid transferase [Marinobacter nanhaiticus D15-8W]BES69919.1 lipid IV(A) 3-deoxy-D-manno-octulosonic acid transferase [Marinobacter nanhaiticus D15-8W]
MVHYLYSFVFRLILPFLLIRLWWIGRRSPELLAHWQDRLGLIPDTGKPVIWVHAVSVGETIAAAPLVKALLARRPHANILMTAMTATGRARAKALFGDAVTYAYSPYDSPGSVRRFLKRAHPQALVVMETELWPNMISRTAAAGVPIFLINARLSERSARGYQRVSGLVRSLLGKLNWIAAQADSDARRFVAIGAAEDQVSVTGSIKFDVDVTDALRADARALRSQLGRERRVWIAASTHEGEDQQILDAHSDILQKHPDALLILVPRHPERFDDVAALVRQQGLSMLRRSADKASDASQVYLGDTMGELMMLYGVADLAFVGGSLIERGGHNPLEPAAWAMPVATGPHVFNFADIYERLDRGGGVVKALDASTLAAAVNQCFDDPERAGTLGRNALAVVDANRGALERVVDGILQKLD